MKENSSKKWLFTGLGNVGEPYQHTRHNIGFDIVDSWVFSHKATVWETGRYASFCTVKTSGKQVRCIKPTTYMNLSGQAIHYWMKKLDIPIENCLIITDDIALPLGKIRLRLSGTDGGHNGLKNITECLQSKYYPRIRCGIGDAFTKSRQAEYVLGKWRQEEQEKVKQLVEEAQNALSTVIKMGVSRAMNSINARKEEV